MKWTPRGPALALGTAFWLLAGCADDGQSGMTRPDSRPTALPAINRPLDANAYRDKPCDLLTTDQAAARGLTPAPDLRHEPIDGPRCYWRGTSAGKDPILRLWLRPDDQLDQIYRRDPSQAQIWSEFVPVTVAGQPAARSSPTSSRTGGPQARWMKSRAEPVDFENAILAGYCTSGQLDAQQECDVVGSSR